MYTILFEIVQHKFYVDFSLEICLHPSFPWFHCPYRNLFQHFCLVFVYWPFWLSLLVVAVRELDPGEKIEVERQKQLQSLELGAEMLKF